MKLPIFRKQKINFFSINRHTAYDYFVLFYLVIFNYVSFARIIVDNANAVHITSKSLPNTL